MIFSYSWSSPLIIQRDNSLPTKSSNSRKSCAADLILVSGHSTRLAYLANQWCDAPYPDMLASACQLAVPQDEDVKWGPLVLLPGMKRGTAMDYYAGIDVSLEQSSVCIVDSLGKVTLETKLASEPPATSPRLIAGLMFLQHSIKLSDEAVIARGMASASPVRFSSSIVRRLIRAPYPGGANGSARNGWNDCSPRPGRMFAVLGSKCTRPCFVGATRT